MKIKKNTYMGQIRAITKEKSNDYLIKHYSECNAEGRKATYDELVSRGNKTTANILRYGRRTKPKAKKRNLNPLF